MTTVTDDELRAQLVRRAGSPLPAAGGPVAPASAERGRRLASAIASQVASEAQARRWPWARLRPPALLRGFGPPWPAVSGVVVALAIVALAAATLPGRLAGPAASPSTTATPATSAWYLTTAQLEQVVAATATSSKDVGKTIVADVRITDIGPVCAAPASAPTFGGLCGETVIAGTDPPVPVTDAHLPIACPAPTNPEACYTLPAPGSTALTIEPGSVTYVGTVDLGTTNPTPWPVEQYLTTSVYGQDLALVDGWISAGIAPPCPMPANGVDPNLPFGCGAAAWLTTDPFQATTSSAGSTDLVEPGRGIRVQNNAFDDFSPTTTAVDSIGLPAAQHGFFLLAPATAPANCFLCSTEVAEILGRVDPVGIPALTTASTPEPQGTVPTPVPTSMDPLATKAFEMASQFESARATGDWATAWSLLGPATQQVFGSQQRFADQEEAYNGTGADVFDVTAPVQDPAEIGTSMLGPAWNELVPANAWYVAIDHPKVVGASAGLEGLVVAIAKDGEWRVWIVH